MVLPVNKRESCGTAHPAKRRREGEASLTMDRGGVRFGHGEGVARGAPQLKDRGAALGGASEMDGVRVGEGV